MTDARWTQIQVGFGGSMGTEIRYGGLHPGATLRYSILRSDKVEITRIQSSCSFLLVVWLLPDPCTTRTISSYHFIFLQPTVTLPLIEQSLEVLSTNIKIYASTDSYFKWINLMFLFDFMQNNRRRSDCISQNSDSSNSSELDLELTPSLWVKCYGKVGSKSTPNS